MGRLLFNDRRRQIGIDSKTDRRKRRAEIADQIVIAPAGQDRLADAVKITAEDDAGIIFNLVDKPQIDDHAALQPKLAQIIVNGTQIVKALTRAVLIKKRIRLLKDLLAAEQPRQIPQRQRRARRPKRIEQVAERRVIFLFDTLTDLFLCLSRRVQAVDQRLEVSDMAKLDAESLPADV